MEDRTWMGRLAMPNREVICPPATPSWSDSIINIAALFITVILVFIFFEAIRLSVRSAISSLYNWRMNHTIDRNVRILRSRRVSIFTAALAVSLYLSASLGFFLPTAMLLVAGYLILKFITYNLTYAWIKKKEAVRNEFSASWNYLLLIFSSIAILGSCGIMLRLSQEITRTVIEVFASIIAAVSIFREFQILSNSYSRLLSFLYLCALELIPIAGLIASIILL